MTRNAVTIDVTSANSAPTTGLIEWWEDGRECNVSVRCEDQESQGSAADFFDAFCEARIPFESCGYRFQCNGASLNVRPSGMARDMGRGLKAYYLTLGKSGGELREIFAAGPGIQPATVSEQEEFYALWLQSLED